MREIDMTTLSQPEAYKLLIGTVLPRPIAWVSTMSKEGKSNLAPFSFFTATGSNPPGVVFCPASHVDGSEKDTLRNIRETGEFVVNFVSQALLTKMNDTAAPWPREVSEFDAVGLASLPSVKVRPLRVKESQVQLECTLHSVVDFGVPAAAASHVVIGLVVYAHLAEGVSDEAMHIDMKKLQPVGRLSGSTYTFVENIVDLPRPTVAGAGKSDVRVVKPEATPM